MGRRHHHRIILVVRYTLDRIVAADRSATNLRDGYNTIA